MQTKLTPDAGLTRGPRPSVWDCTSTGAYEAGPGDPGMLALRRQIEMDQGIIVITRDELAVDLENGLKNCR